VGALVREVTEQLGKYYTGVRVRDLYDWELQSLVKDFQTRNGLEPTGFVDRRTLAALSLDPKEKKKKLDKIVKSIDNGLATLPYDFPDKAIVVNIPSYELIVYEHGREIMRSKVIVGKADTPTPTMKTAITAIKYNPDWSVPPGIARDYRSLLAQYGREWFTQRGIQVNGSGQAVNFYQPPGPQNPLGYLKFELNNPYNVYMHDTPNRDFFQFEEQGRDISHGCIRIEKYVEVASWASGHDISTIQSNINTGRMYLEPVPRIPVYVTYFLTYPDENGKPEFFKDVYKKYQ
jgi:murein L,D-transpeptidase YcbB/YkuD